MDDDAELLCDDDDGLPAGLGRAGVALAFHEGDEAVAEVVEVAKSHAGRGVVIEHDIGDAGRLAVRRDSDDGGRNVEGELRIDEEKTIDTAAHEEFLILVFEIGLAEMADGEVEKTFLEKVLLDAEHDSGEVALAKFGSDDAEGVGEAGGHNEVGERGGGRQIFCLRLSAPLMCVPRN